MADAIVSAVLDQLVSVILEEMRQEVSLIGDVKKEVNNLRSNLEAIQAVLVDAEQRQVKETSVRRWLDQLKYASYDMEDVLDEWNTAIMKFQIEGGNENNAFVPKGKVCCSFLTPCFGIKQIVLRRDIALKIKEINETLDEIAKEKDRYRFNMIPTIDNRPQQVQSTYVVDVSEIYGRNYEKDILVSKLLSKDDVEPKGVEIISIVGLGGIGKTTLAQFAYNDSEVMNHFEKRAWVCVSDPFDECRVAKAIIEDLESSTPNLAEFNSLIKKIHESIKGKKFLLVLDDVWTEDYQKWEPFHYCLSSGSHGSKVLITTRKESVAYMMKSINIINVKELSKLHNWSLFKKLAFCEKSFDECERLEDIGREIVRKCKGLPLATKTIGSLLRFKSTREEWLHILNSEMWRVEEIEKGLFSPLLLSYNDLPSPIKRCFSYCAIFPKDYRIVKDQLIKLWMAQGFLSLEKNIDMERVGLEYFDHLATRSFFQEFREHMTNGVTCKMHDIVHDFAQYLSKDECFSMEFTDIKEPIQSASHERVHHSMLITINKAPIPKSIFSIKRLRSLLLSCENSDDLCHNDNLLKLFTELTCLRALRLNFRINYMNIYQEIIPKEIEKLMHLRYLNLSMLEIVKLPEALCELYNLQTLDISCCRSLKELPQEIGKLINLRHLMNYYTDSLIYMPVGIKRLTCLHTLKEFVVSESDDNKAASLECLKDLNHLQGHLEIRALGNLTNVKSGVAVLKNTEISSLDLQFDKKGEAGRANEDDEIILEALYPPVNLEKLNIGRYRGSTFSTSWISTLTVTKLCLKRCKNIMHLHPLGKLSFLEELEIFFLGERKMVDNEFWGIKSDGISSSSSSSSVTILFPKLKFLKLCNLEWEEWDYKDVEDIIFMPRLTSMDILLCKKLMGLPDSLLQRTTLKELRINESNILHERYKKRTGEDWHKISHIPNICIDYKYVQGGRLR